MRGREWVEKSSYSTSLMEAGEAPEEVMVELWLRVDEDIVDGVDVEEER